MQMLKKLVQPMVCQWRWSVKNKIPWLSSAQSCRLRFLRRPTFASLSFLLNGWCRSWIYIFDVRRIGFLNSIRLIFLRPVFRSTRLLPLPRQILDSVLELFTHGPNFVIFPDFLSYTNRWGFLVLLPIVLSDPHKCSQSRKTLHWWFWSTWQDLP